MRCPVCLDQELVAHHRSGVETDHCPRCKGIWLDRGELEKLLDHIDVVAPASRPERPRDDDRRRDDDRSRDDRKKSKKKKRKSAFADMLEEVLDVFD